VQIIHHLTISFYLKNNYILNLYMDKVRPFVNDIILLSENEFKLDFKNYKNIADEVLDTKCLQFYNLLDNNDLFSLFLNQKIKVFSSKTEETNELSNCLFDEDMSLKRILNNRTELQKCKIWYKLFVLYLEMEKLNKNRDDRINSLNKIIDEQVSKISLQVKENMFGECDINNTTNNMIEDIVGSLQNSMSSSGNPFENIMNITSKITDKYQSKIENGEIEIDKILGNITSNIPMFKDMKEKKEEEKKPVVMDDNFSTADVEVKEEKEETASNNINIGNILNMTQNMPDLSNIGNIINNLSNVESENDIQNIQNDMNNMLSNMGLDPNELNKKMEELNNKFSNSK
jgi:hypothetical protein